MSLIKCPECGKEISDKSANCIHCGFPLRDNNTQYSKKNICIVDGTAFDFSDILDEVNAFYEHNLNPTVTEKSNIGLAINRKIRALTKINDVAGATLAIRIISTKSIPETFDSLEHLDPISFNKSKIVCPRCGSNAIATGARGVNWTLGLIGAGKTVNRCGKCGHTWQPK